MQTESMHNDIGMPLEQGQPRGHGGGRLCPYCKTDEIPESCRGNNGPKTCGDPECVAAHKIQCRKNWNNKNKARMRVLNRRWYEKNRGAEFLSRKENRLAKIERRENARVLPIVIRQLKREAMFREGLASCSYCKAVLPRAEVRIPKNDPRKLAGECKRCRARNAKATRKNNPETYRRLRIKHNARVKADPTKRFVKSVRDRTSKALVNAKTRKQQGTSSMKYIGCTRDELRQYIEMQFKPGMSWDNYGRSGRRAWHVDHIIPVASFDLSKEEERHKAFHYTNLQPLWARDNIRKSNRFIPKAFQPNLLYPIVGSWQAGGG